MAEYAGEARREVWGHYSWLHLADEVCSVVKGRLGFTRPVQAVSSQGAESGRDADEAREQWEWLRRRLRRSSPPRRIPAELYRAYEESTGTYLGCD
jgi:hypothetical protein